jgi:hypothetical protein
VGDGNDAWIRHEMAQRWARAICFKIRGGISGPDYGTNLAIQCGVGGLAMRSGLVWLLLTFIVIASGCAEPHHEMVTANAMTAPCTAMYSRRDFTINPNFALAGADNPDFWMGRAEKAVYGAVPLAGTSYFTTYTYDSQAISTLGNSGYRYRWVVQQGISAPVAP